MSDKIIFLIQVYFGLSFLCTFFVLGVRLPHEIQTIKKYKMKRTLKDNLEFIRNVIISLLFFPIIAFYLGLKEI